MDLIQKPDEYIREKREEYNERDEPGRGSFHKGQAAGYDFVLQEGVGDEEVLERLISVNKQVSAKYSWVRILDWLPVVNHYFLKKAHYYDGYMGALLDSIGCFIDNTGEKSVLRRTDTEERVAVLEEES